MRIMLDTNVLLSAVIFRSKMMWNMMARIMEDHRLVLSSYVIDECYEVVERKKPSLIPALDRLFESIPFEMVHTPQILPNTAGLQSATRMMKRFCIPQSRQTLTF